MIWRRLVDMVMLPVHWFWKKYETYKEQDQLGNAIAVLILSVFGLLAIIGALFFLTLKLVDLGMAYPAIPVVMIIVIWLYAYARSSNRHTQDNTQQMINQRNTETAELEAQANQGYPAMLNVIYQTIRAVAGDIGGCTPTFQAEVEMKEGHYVISGNLYFYIFKLDKEDIHSLTEEKMLTEYKNTLQYHLGNKLHSGAFKSIQFVDFRDQYGHGYDGIVIDHIEDFGMFYVIYAVYASQEYSEYRHNLSSGCVANQNQQVLTESWNSK